MSLFADEVTVTGEVKIHPIRFAATGDVTAEGVALTLGDVVLFKYADKNGTNHVVVATDSDTLAIRT